MKMMTTMTITMMMMIKPMRVTKLTINDFSAAFGDIFSGKLNINFGLSGISEKEREDIDNFLVYFSEKVLNRREFI